MYEGVAAPVCTLRDDGDDGDGGDARWSVSFATMSTTTMRILVRDPSVSPYLPYAGITRVEVTAGEGAPGGTCRFGCRVESADRPADIAVVLRIDRRHNQIILRGGLQRGLPAVNSSDRAAASSADPFNISGSAGSPPRRQSQSNVPLALLPVSSPLPLPLKIEPRFELTED